MLKKKYNKFVSPRPPSVTLAIGKRSVNPNLRCIRPQWSLLRYHMSKLYLPFHFWNWIDQETNKCVNCMADTNLSFHCH